MPRSNSATVSFGFRLANETLCFRFTATASSRVNRPLERIASPESLGAWLAANGLNTRGTVPTAAEVQAALRLREAIYRLGSFVARGRRPDQGDIDILNDFSSSGSVYQTLVNGKAEWAGSGHLPVLDSLPIIAADAVRVLGGQASGQIKVCEGEECGGLFIDASRGLRRKWCSMNTCGNKAKKASLRASRIS